MKSFEMLSMFSHKIKAKDKDYIRLFYSIKEKMGIHNYFLSQIDEYFKKVKQEMDQWDGKGVKSSRSHTILLAYFEALLNNDYSIMETIAKITLPFFPKSSLPRTFHNQLEWFIREENKKFDLEYSDYLSKNMEWYHSLREIRTEPVHFLSGLIVFDKDENGLHIPKYSNIIKSERKRTGVKSDSINIGIDFAHKIGKDTKEFLEFYGGHFLSQINPDAKTTVLTLNQGTGKIKPIEVTLKDLLSEKIKMNEVDSEKLPKS